jgi:hypothetical protein
VSRPASLRAGFAVAAVALLGAVPAIREACAAGDPAIEALMAAKAPAVVSVKCVLKIHRTRGGESRDGEANLEIRGTVVDPSGLVLVGNDSLDGIPRATRAQLKAAGMEISTTPRDVKVLFGNEAKEHAAAVVARDSNLGLCFIQILDPEVKPTGSIDFTKTVEPGVGQTLFSVTRKPRGYDCAPVFGRFFVTGRVDKPRSMFSVSGQNLQEGFPAYDLSGALVGVVTNQIGAEGVQGGSSETFMLPLPVVRRVLEQVRKRVPEVLEKAKAEKEAAKEEPKETPKEPAMAEEPAPEKPK